MVRVNTFFLKTLGHCILPPSLKGTNIIYNFILRPHSCPVHPQVADRGNSLPEGYQVILRKAWLWTIVGNVLRECHGPRMKKDPSVEFEKEYALVSLQKAKFFLHLPTVAVKSHCSCFPTQSQFLYKFPFFRSFFLVMMYTYSRLEHAFIQFLNSAHFFF